MRCYPVSPLHWLTDGDVRKTVWVHSQAPIPSLALVDLHSPSEMKAFLSCVAAGLQGACGGPVYLCNKVIRGSVITRPSLCTFSLSLPHALFCSHLPPSPSFTISLSPSSNFFFKPHHYPNPFADPCWHQGFFLMWWRVCTGKRRDWIKLNVYR